jgi:Putative MetA-pathway of phenol degradation
MKRCLLAAAAAAVSAILAAPSSLRAQDLTPRAYLITPVRSNAVNLSYIFNDGELLFEGTVPITDATGRLSVPALSLYHSLSLFGRSANVTATLPYAVGNFEGTAFGTETSVYRSGLMDSVFRFAVNLMGAPAMELSEVRKWQQKHLLGASLKIVAPTGQYDPTKLINLGANRWAFKPELGLSRRWGHWLLDAYGSVWLFTENPEFFSKNQYFPGVQAQTQDPVAVLETHLSYDVRPRFWMSLDANFWRGGTTSANGVENPATFQQNSRVGITGAFPVTRHQSVKLSYSRGAYIRFGGDYQILSAAWQYSWISGSKPGPATR